MKSIEGKWQWATGSLEILFAEINCQWEGRKSQEIDCCIEELTEKKRLWVIFAEDNCTGRRIVSYRKFEDISCWRQLTVERGCGLQKTPFAEDNAQERRQPVKEEAVGTPSSVKIVQEEVKMVTSGKR